MPSQDGTRLVVTLRAVERELDGLARALPTGRVHVDRVHGVADVLRHLADHMDAVCGIATGEPGDKSG